MALKTIMLRHEIERKEAELAALREKDKDFQTREAELEAAIAEVQTDEERTAMETEIAGFENERDNHNAAVSGLEAQVEELRGKLSEAEKMPNINQRAGAPANKERSDAAVLTEINIRSLPMNRRAFDALPYQERQRIVAQEDTQTFLRQLRSMKGQTRAINGADLLIPEVLLDLIFENRFRYSKLLNRVRRRTLKGKGKQPVSGTRNPAVWVGRYKRLNALTLVFNAVELDDFKNAGIIIVNNEDLEDSDMNLASYIVEELSESIGLSDDMAILYGRGPTGNMPLGVVTRLAQQSQPENYPEYAPAWVDLHTTNIITINGPSLTGAQFWEALNEASGNTFTKYSRGELSWAMNSKTYNYLKGKAIATSVTGEWVSLIGGALPIISGQIDVLEFMPDYDIVGGYFDLYLWGQRLGMTIGMDDMGIENRINDTTIFFGKERADGLPVIAGAFVAINIHNSAPATTILFPTDDANTVTGLLLNTATASIAGTGTFQLTAIPMPFGVEAGAVTWASGTSEKATVSSTGLVTGVTAGSSVITATCNGYTAQCTVTVT